ncbi:MAG: 4Fe-4S dicluster domain-containing protein [Gemmataceae bacterium]
MPALNAARCTGCGRCVECCPTQCLDLLDGLPWLPRPRDCISCTACQRVCPTQAISFQPLTRETTTARNDI